MTSKHDFKVGDLIQFTDEAPSVGPFEHWFNGGDLKLGVSYKIGSVFMGTIRLDLPGIIEVYDNEHYLVKKVSVLVNNFETTVESKYKF